VSGFPRSAFRMVPFGDLIERVRQPVDVLQHSMYDQIGIRSHGRGVFHKEAITGEQLGEKAVFQVEPDCLIFNIIFAWEGAVAVTTSREVGRVASHRFPMFRVNGDEVDLEFLRLFLTSKRGLHMLRLASPGGAGRNRTLSLQELGKSLVPLPDVHVQRRIARMAKLLDRAASCLDELIEAKRRLKRALLQQRLGRCMHRLRVDEVAQVNPESLPESTPGTYRFRYVDLGSVNRGMVDWPEVDIEFDSAPSRARRIVADGDILMATVRPTLLGFARLRNLPTPTIASTGFAVIRARQPRDGEFIYQSLFAQTFVKQLEARLAGSSFPAVSAKDVAALQLRWPACEDRLQLSSCLSSCDEEIGLLNRQLTAYRRLKRGLMQQLLSGEFVVPSDQRTPTSPQASS
jgi:type I restriction enzyme, S subunit